MATIGIGVTGPHSPISEALCTAAKAGTDRVATPMEKNITADNTKFLANETVFKLFMGIVPHIMNKNINAIFQSILRQLHSA
jgi:hypothetical protein